MTMRLLGSESQKEKHSLITPIIIAPLYSQPVNAIRPLHNHLKITPCVNSAGKSGTLSYFRYNFILLEY